jgi:hypothetical protein
MVSRVASVLLLLVAASIGCDGRAYSLTIERRSTPIDSAAVLAKIDEVARANQFRRVDIANDTGAHLRDVGEHLASYRADVVPYPRASGAVGISVNQSNANRLNVQMWTFPAFDYNEAQAFRVQLKAEMGALMPDASLNGF